MTKSRRAPTLGERFQTVLQRCKDEGLSYDQANELIKKFCDGYKIGAEEVSRIILRDRASNVLAMTSAITHISVVDLNKLANIFDPEGKTDFSESAMARRLKESLTRALKPITRLSQGRRR